MHGFRYLELSGITTAPELEEVKALQYSSVDSFDDSFQCSNPLLNRFAENVKWSQLCNFISIPTDCPQRNERMGWAGDTQCSYALALEYEVAEDREQMASHLARCVRENDYKVGTGFFGTGLLNRALSRNGYTEEAYRLLLQTQFPSWLYPVTQGATTIWEHWDSYTKEQGFGTYSAMNSFNHYSLGSVLSWMYEDILGIQKQEGISGIYRVCAETADGRNAGLCEGKCGKFVW